MKIKILDEAHNDLVEQEVVQVYAVLDCRRNPKVNHEQLIRRSVSGS